MYRGTGLGLTITLRLVTLMGGTIALTSAKGTGTEFTVVFPCQSRNKQPKPLKTELPSMVPTDSYFTILIAEDEKSNYLYLEKLLEKTHCTLLWAKTGNEVLEIMRTHPVNLILMDIKMPEKNGIDTMKEIRLTAPDLPIIAQTAYAHERTDIMSIQPGFDDILLKPILAKAFGLILNKYLPAAK